jgi:Ca2+-transporting ATPase
MGASARPWQVPIEELLRDLRSGAGGLSAAEAAARLAREGPNELPEPRARHALRRLLDQLTHFMAVLLWIAGALAFAARTPQLGWAIWAVVLVNAAFSFWQEEKAERALAALRRSMPHDARAWRDGRIEIVPARLLVAGDVVELAQGDRIPADGRLLSADALRVDLSLLTGESVPVGRAPATSEPLCALAAEAASAVLAGASVVSGRGRAVVWATGSRTELGGVARLTAGVERLPSTLSVQVARLVRFITVLSVAVGVSVFALGWLLLGLEPWEGMVFAIGMIVANVPEGLAPTVTLALALSVQRMARRRVLVRQLPAIETLSAVTVICTDKTGTLTENRMAVQEVWLPGGAVELAPGAAGADPRLRLLLAGGALCTEAATVAGPGAEHAVARDPLEAALLAAARRAGLEPTELYRATPRLREIPFDPARRMMTVVARVAPEWLGAEPGALLVFTKGAPADVLDRCDRLLDAAGARPLGAGERRAIADENDRLAGRSCRTLALAFREDGRALELPPPSLEEGLVFLGLVAVRDPPRPGVRRALETCRRAGIRVTMVTGDYGVTAEAVAREVGLVSGPARVVSGPELSAMGEERLRQVLRGDGDLLFARVLPEQKLRLVKAWQALGEVVAVTGDGVNDAPALRAGHVGIAMGASGTDVARAAADIVLLDDDFASLAAAVEEGRAIFRNIRKFLTYILTSNVPELTPFLAMVALRIPPALNILQILAVDLGTDMVPALALGGEPPEPGLMDRPPRPKESPLLDRRLLLRAYLRLGLAQAAASMAAFAAVYLLAGVGLEGMRAVAPALRDHAADPATAGTYRLATTAAFAAIVVCQMGNLFACRSERVSAFRVGWTGNRLLWIGLAVEVAIALLVTYAPPLQRVLGTASLPAAAWPLLLAGPALLLLVDEAAKWARRRRGRRRQASSSSATTGA